MQINKIICDICGKEIDTNKTRWSYNSPIRFEYDICQDCFKKILARSREERNSYGE